MFLLVLVSVVVCSFCSISLLVSGLWQKLYLPFNAIKLWKICASTTSTACTSSRISHAVFCFYRNLFQFSIIFLCSFVVSVYTPMCTSNKKGDINNIFSIDMPFLPRFKFCLCLNKFIWQAEVEGNICHLNSISQYLFIHGTPTRKFFFLKNIYVPVYMK